MFFCAYCGARGASVCNPARKISFAVEAFVDPEDEWCLQAPFYEGFLVATTTGGVEIKERHNFSVKRFKELFATKKVKFRGPRPPAVQEWAPRPIQEGVDCTEIFPGLAQGEAVTIDEFVVLKDEGVYGR